MNSNAFLPSEYHTLDELALIDAMSHIDEVISCLPDDLEPLREEAEEARQRLFEEFCRRGKLPSKEEIAD